MTTKLTSQIGSDRNLIQGKALKFDSGNNTYINFGDINKGIKSIDFWVRPTGSSPTMPLIDFDGGTNYIEIKDGEITASGFSSVDYYVNSIDGERTLIGNKWNNVCIITSDTDITGSALTIGKLSSEYFTGSITDIKLSSNEITNTEISKSYNNSVLTSSYDSLYIPICESTGSILHDISGNRNSGSIINIQSDTWQNQGISPNILNRFGYNDYSNYLSEGYSWPAQLVSGAYVPCELSSSFIYDVYNNSLINSGRAKTDYWLTSGSIIGTNVINSNSKIYFNTNSESLDILPFENQFFNKKSLTNNSDDLPEFWRNEFQSRSNWDSTEEWVIKDSETSASLCVNNIYSFGTKDIWSKIYLQENYTGDNVTSFQNLLVYDNNKTNSEIYNIANFFDSNNSLTDINNWLERKNAIINYSSDFGVIYSGSSNEEILQWLDTSKEKNINDNYNIYNWYDITLSGSGDNPVKNSSGILFTTSSKGLSIQEIDFEEINFIEDSWTFYLKHTPNKYTSSEMVIFSTETSSYNPYQISVSIGEFENSSDIKLTVVSRSTDETLVWSVFDETYVTCSADEENIFIATYDSSSYLLTLNSYYSGSWIDSSSIYLYNLTSSAYSNSIDSGDFEDGYIYSGSIKNLRIYKSTKDRDDTILWN